MIVKIVLITSENCNSNKSAQGFNHPIVGKLLCPLWFLPEYEADPM